MKLSTKHFGEMEIDEKGIIDFPEGVPGFGNTRRYIFINNEEEGSPFKWMQCVDLPELAFAVVDPFAIKKDYDIEINDDVIDKLRIEKAEDALVYSIVVVPEDISKISMNLKAPVIINSSNKMGAQVVLDTDRYSVRHYILEELRRQEEAGNACTDKEEESVDCNK